MTAIGQIRHGLHRREVLRVFLEIEELAQQKMRREFYFIEILFHNNLFLFSRRVAEKRRGNSCKQKAFRVKTE